MYSLLKDRISQLRKNRELTQQAFADKLQVGRQAIIKWEGGVKPQSENIEAILKAFPEVRREWFLEGTGAMYELKVSLPELENQNNKTARDILMAYYKSMGSQVTALDETQQHFKQLIMSLQ